jgi:hypothetical protein
MERETPSAGPSLATFPIIGVIALLALGGCGRIGYTAVELAGPDDGGARRDGAPADNLDGRPGEPAPEVGSPPLDGTGETGAVDPAGTDGPLPPHDAAPDTTPALDLVIDRPPDGSCTGNCQPTGVEFQEQNATALRGTGPGTILRCPSNKALFGYRGSISRNPNYPWLQSLAALCGSIAIRDGSVTMAESMELPTQGSSSGDAYSRVCPSDQFLVGFDGWAGSWIGQLSFRCAPLVVSGASLSLGPVTTLPLVGSRSGSEFPTTDCPPGQLAVGHQVAVDSFVKGFGLVCATPIAVAR